MRKHSEQPDTQQLRAELEELRSQFRHLAPVVRSNRVDDSWVHHEKKLSDLVLHDDPRRFLRWDIIRQTMSAGRQELYVLKELWHLWRTANWKDRWQPALAETAVGSPPLYHLYPRSSANLIHHTYHVCRFEEVTRLEIPSFHNVTEVGGGYGSMCRLLFKLGFQGYYAILDLPGFSALQRFFLRSLGLPVVSSDRSRTGIQLLCDIGQLASLSPPADGGALAIATWSLSEMPLIVREDLEPHLLRSHAFLFAYQEHFGGVNNLEYFQGLRSRAGVARWYDIPILHLRGSRYLFGVR